MINVFDQDLSVPNSICGHSSKDNIDTLEEFLRTMEVYATKSSN